MQSSRCLFFTRFPWYNTLQSSPHLRDFFFTRALNYALIYFTLLSWHMINHNPPTFMNKNNCRTNHFLHLLSRFGYTETILQADKIMYIVDLQSSTILQVENFNNKPTYTALQIKWGIQDRKSRCLEDFDVVQLDLGSILCSIFFSIDR